MNVYVVTSMTRYESSDEVFFGANAIFSTREEANAYIEQEINKIVSGENEDDHALFYGPEDVFAKSVSVDMEDYTIGNSSHVCRWEVNDIALPEKIQQMIRAEGRT